MRKLPLLPGTKIAFLGDSVRLPHLPADVAVAGYTVADMLAMKPNFRMSCWANDEGWREPKKTKPPRGAKG